MILFQMKTLKNIGIAITLLLMGLPLTGQDRPLIDTLITQGKAIVSEDPDASLLLTYEAYDKSLAEDYYWGNANAAGWISEAYYYKGQMDNMDKYNYIALQLSRDENDLEAISDNLKSISQSLSDRGNQTEALTNFYEAQKI